MDERKSAGDLFLELEEARRLDEPAEDGGIYSITITYGEILTIICCG